MSASFRPATNTEKCGLKPVGFGEHQLSVHDCALSKNNAHASARTILGGRKIKSSTSQKPPSDLVRRSMKRLTFIPISLVVLVRPFKSFSSYNTNGPIIWFVTFVHVCVASCVSACVCVERSTLRLEFPQQVKAPEVLRHGAAGWATSQRWMLAADPQIQKPKYATHTVPTCSNVISRVSFGDVP